MIGEIYLLFFSYIMLKLNETRSTWLGLPYSLFSNDTTQAGYSLGMPEGRSTAPSPERSLSPAACCLVRALMHSALLWASCNNEVSTVDNVYCFN